MTWLELPKLNWNQHAVRIGREKEREPDDAQFNAYRTVGVVKNRPKKKKKEKKTEPGFAR